MKKTNDLLPEEQHFPHLVGRLKEIYTMRVEDQASLARIEAQVAARLKVHRTESSLEEEEEIQSLKPGTIYQFPRTRSDRDTQGYSAHPRNGWRQRLRLLPAVAVVVLITIGATILFTMMRNAQNHSIPVTGGKPPDQQTNGTQATKPIHQPIYLTSGLRLAMISEQVSWVIGSSAQATDYSELARTADGGKTWRRVNIPEGSSALGYTVVIDEVTALVPVGDILSNKYWITFDGGVNWQHFDLPIPKSGSAQDAVPNHIAFLDHSHAWVVERNELFRTENTGKTWLPVATVPKDGPFDNSFVFTDMQTGWFASNNLLFATHDGGKTWKQLQLPAPPVGGKTPTMLRNLTFTSPRDGSVFFGAGQDTSSNVYLYITQDGGKSWKIQGNALPYDSGFRRMIDPTHVLGSALDVRTQQFGPAIITLTNGKWTGTVIRADTEGDDFVSAQVGFVLLKPQNKPLEWYKTSDGGKTWVKVGTLP